MNVTSLLGKSIYNSGHYNNPTIYPQPPASDRRMEEFILHSKSRFNLFESPTSYFNQLAMNLFIEFWKDHWKYRPTDVDFYKKKLMTDMDVVRAAALSKLSNAKSNFSRHHRMETDEAYKLRVAEENAKARKRSRQTTVGTVVFITQ